MATAYKCDRCKCHFDGTALARIELTVSEKHQNYYTKLTDTNAELCDDCASHVFKAITETPPREAKK